MNYSKSTSIDTIGSSLVPLRRMNFAFPADSHRENGWPRRRFFSKCSLQIMVLAMPADGDDQDKNCLFVMVGWVMGFVCFPCVFYIVSFVFHFHGNNDDFISNDSSYLRSPSNMPYLRRSNWSSRDSCVSFAK